MKSLLLFLVLLLMTRLGQLEQKICKPAGQSCTTSVDDVDAEVKPKTGKARFLEYLRKARQAKQQVPVDQLSMIDNTEDGVPSPRPKTNQDHFLQRLQQARQQAQERDQVHQQTDLTQPVAEESN